MLNLGKIKCPFVLEHEHTIARGQVRAFVHLQFLSQADLHLGYHVYYL